MKRGIARSQRKETCLRATLLIFMKILVGCVILGALQSTSTRKSKMDEGNLQRRVLTETTNTSKTGMKATLIRRLVTSCSGTTAAIGDNSTSTVASRQESIRCAVYRSKARAAYLRNQKTASHDNGEQKHYPSHKSAESPGYTPLLPSNSILDSSSENNYYSDSWASSGEYVMTYELGTPAKSYIGIADTGSDLTWLQCIPCYNCYSEPDSYYNPSSSSTYDQISCGSEICYELSTTYCDYYYDSCDYFYAYGDTSHTLGTLASETITLNNTKGNTTSFSDFIFGCGHDNSGSFGSISTDGIVGLGQGTLSLPTQLGAHFCNKFSYCLISRDEGSEQSSDIYFGEIAVPTGNDIQYTPILSNKYYTTYYYVNFTGISVGGSMLDISYSTLAINQSDGTGGTIFDSGTTYTQLATEAYNAVIEAFQSEVSYEIVDNGSGLLCYDVSDVSNPTFPSMTFYFTSLDMVLPQDNYFIDYGDSSTQCLAIGNSSDFSIIGNVQQQNFHILYDGENSQMAFKPTQCDQEYITTS